MISCYLLSFLSFLMLLVAMLQNYFHFRVFAANEITFIVLTSIIYLFTETLIIFFFVGTGVSIKEYTIENKLAGTYHQKSIAIKRKVYPPQLLNMLFLMTLFVLIGAVDTGKIPLWSYRVYFIFCLWHFAYAKKIQHVAFRENTDNVLAMSGVERKG